MGKFDTVHASSIAAELRDAYDHGNMAPPHRDVMIDGR